MRPDIVSKADSPLNVLSLCHQNSEFQNVPHIATICLHFKTVYLKAAAVQSVGNYEIFYSGELP